MYFFGHSCAGKRRCIEMNMARYIAPTKASGGRGMLATPAWLARMGKWERELLIMCIIDSLYLLHSASRKSCGIAFSASSFAAARSIEARVSSSSSLQNSMASRALADAAAAEIVPSRRHDASSFEICRHWGVISTARRGIPVCAWHRW